MLTALPTTRQNQGEARRVWYFSSSIDMYVWFDVQDAPCAFELTYKTRCHQERTVSWHHERGYRHWMPLLGRRPIDTLPDDTPTHALRPRLSSVYLAAAVSDCSCCAISRCSCSAGMVFCANALISGSVPLSISFWNKAMVSLCADTPISLA